jgi:hypothetical protein
MKLVPRASFFSLLLFCFTVGRLQCSPHEARTRRDAEAEPNHRQPVTRPELSIQPSATEETDQDAQR